MTKIKIEGKNALIVGKLITESLRDSGLKVNHWHDVTPSEVAKCRRDAVRKDADISIVSMSR